MQKIHLKTLAIFPVNFFHYLEKDSIIFPDFPGFQKQVLNPQDHSGRLHFSNN